MAAQTFSMTQLVALWIKAGGPLSTAPAAVARAWSESTGRAAVTSANPDGGTNVGLWQLDTRGVGAGHSVAELQQPLTNAQITVRATHGGRDWAEWADNWTADIGQATAAARSFGDQASGHPGGAGGLAEDILHGIEGGIGSALGIPSAGVSALSGIGSGLAGAISLPGQVTGFFSAAERFVHAAMWILDPVNWVRILAGAAAAVLLILGLGALARAA
jgi:Lysozyme like domain